MFKSLEKYYDIKYELGGRDFNSCDCYGLCYLYNKVDMEKELPMYLEENTSSYFNIAKAFKKRKSEWFKVSDGKEKIGDIVYLKVKNLPIHVGVVVSKNIMMHIIENRPVSIESYKTGKWLGKLDSIWRYETIN